MDIIQFKEEDHPLWNYFTEWSNINVSPGGGIGHKVEWYWKIWKAAYNATLDEFKKHSICCPARWEAERRTKEDRE